MNSVLYQRNTLCKTCQSLLLILLGQKILFSWEIWSQTDCVKSSWSFGPNWSWLKATQASRTQISLFCPCWFEAFTFFFISPATQRFFFFCFIFFLKTVTLSSLLLFIYSNFSFYLTSSPRLKSAVTSNSYSSWQDGTGMCISADMSPVDWYLPITLRVDHGILSDCPLLENEFASGTLHLVGFNFYLWEQWSPNGVP